MRPIIEPKKWYSWTTHYLLKGKTPSIYLLLIAFIILSINIFFTNGIRLILLYIISVTTIATTTDLVAHLFYDSFVDRISYKTFFKNVIYGRTHDIYGMIINMVSLSILEILNPVKIITVIILYLIYLYVIIILIRSKFYH